MSSRKVSYPKARPVTRPVDQNLETYRKTGNPPPIPRRMADLSESVWYEWDYACPRTGNNRYRIVEFNGRPAVEIFAFGYWRPMDMGQGSDPALAGVAQLAKRLTRTEAMVLDLRRQLREAKGWTE